LWEAYDRLKHKAAPGVDGVAWYGYGQNLLTNRVALHERIHTGRYRAQPVKRQWIDKADGEQRPLRVTCLEDKIVQQALVLILQEIYEPEFLGFSYGFRAGSQSSTGNYFLRRRKPRSSRPEPGSKSERYGQRV